MRLCLEPVWRGKWAMWKCCDAFADILDAWNCFALWRCWKLCAYYVYILYLYLYVFVYVFVFSQVGLCSSQKFWPWGWCVKAAEIAARLCSWRAGALTLYICAHCAEGAEKDFESCYNEGLILEIIGASLDRCVWYQAFRLCSWRAGALALTIVHIVDCAHIFADFFYKLGQSRPTAGKA